MRTSVFNVRVIGYVGDMPIVIYEATEPAEFYIATNWFYSSGDWIRNTWMEAE